MSEVKSYGSGKVDKDGLVMFEPGHKEPQAREAYLKEGITKHWQVICDQRAKIDALQALLTAADERADALEGLLRLARQFVTNGVELGYITMPDPETPDAAHDLVPMIDAALKPAEGGGHDLKPANPRRILSDPHCSECGHPDCNGQCFGDDMMGD